MSKLELTVAKEKCEKKHVLEMSRKYKREGRGVRYISALT